MNTPKITRAFEIVGLISGVALALMATVVMTIIYHRRDPVRLNEIFATLSIIVEWIRYIARPFKACSDTIAEIYAIAIRQIYFDIIRYTEQ